MINEFHAALLNVAYNDAYSAVDFIDPQWKSVRMSPSATRVQQALLLYPADLIPATVRSLEIRQLLADSDLQDLYGMFDPRIGYDPRTLLRQLIQRYEPSVHYSGTQPSTPMTVRGQLLSDGVSPMFWVIHSDGINWSVASSDNPSAPVTGDFVFRGNYPPRVAGIQILPVWTSEDNPTGTSPPDHRTIGDTASITLPANAYDAVLMWSARPRLDLAASAKDLTGPVRDDVVALASEPSIFNRDQLALLQELVTPQNDVATNVCAAALLLAGRNIYPHR